MSDPKDDGFALLAATPFAAANIYAKMDPLYSIQKTLHAAYGDLCSKVEAQIRDSALDPKEWELVTQVEDAEVSAVGRPAVRLTAKLVRRKS